MMNMIIIGVQHISHYKIHDIIWNLIQVECLILHFMINYDFRKKL